MANPSALTAVCRSLLCMLALHACSSDERSDSASETTTRRDGAAAEAAVPECNGTPLPPRARSAPEAVVVGSDAAMRGGLTPYWPTDDWQTSDPSKLGFDGAKLAAALEYAPAQTNTQALLVIRRGYIAAEKYAAAGGAATKFTSYSMAKSFVSAMLGIAIDQGAIAGVDEKLCQYYPEQWRCDDPSDLHGKITIHHAVTLTTGIEWQEDWRTGRGGSGIVGNFVEAALTRPVVARAATRP
jgi:CubicO group peptidase (beta-lactamase class C family)